MFEPKYNLTHTILNNIIKFEIIKSKLESNKLNEKIVKNLQDREKSINILHIAHLIGINLTIKDAERIAEGKRLQTEDARGTILTNYRNILEFTRSSIAQSYVDMDTNILLHLNKLLLTDWKETWEAKIRSAGDNFDSSFDNWLELRDKEINAEDVTDELSKVIEWYKMTQTKIHPIIRVGIFIYRLVRLAPFNNLNKLTFIAVSDYMLYKNNYLSTTYLPISRNFDIYEDEYFESWNNAIQGKFNQETGKVEEREDMTLWLERFTRNLSSDILEVREYLSRQSLEDEKSVKQPFLDLNKRQLKILRYLQTIPTVKREDFVQMMGVSTMTAYRDLDDLVGKKLLKVEGNGRGTRYMLSTR